jgi:hypothetical protein
MRSRHFIIDRKGLDKQRQPILEAWKNVSKEAIMDSTL